jgi:WD40 repeat protein
MTGHTLGLSSLDWSPDGSRMASTSRDGTLKIWDPVAGQQTISIESGVSELLDAEWSPDGTKILVAGSDGYMQIFDAGVQPSQSD